MNYLRILRRRVAGVHRLPVSEGFRVLGISELGSRASQGILDPRCVGVRTAKHAPRGRFYLLKHCHGLAEIVERSGGVLVERHRVITPYLVSACVIPTTNTLRHGYRFAQHRLGFFEALCPKKGHRCRGWIRCPLQKVLMKLTTEAAPQLRRQ